MVEQFTFADDSGIQVDDMMRTSEKDVYAAGDVCTAGWEPAKHWLQVIRENQRCHKYDNDYSLINLIQFAIY